MANKYLQFSKILHNNGDYRESVWAINFMIDSPNTEPIGFVKWSRSQEQFVLSTDSFILGSKYLREIADFAETANEMKGRMP